MERSCKGTYVYVMVYLPTILPLHTLCTVASKQCVCSLCSSLFCLFCLIFSLSLYMWQITLRALYMYMLCIIDHDWSCVSGEYSSTVVQLEIISNYYCRVIKHMMHMLHSAGELSTVYLSHKTTSSLNMCGVHVYVKIL